jgi:DNA-binding transcriptional MerR regulator
MTVTVNETIRDVIGLMSADAVVEGGEVLTLDELTERVGVSVRNIRFYTTRGLVPPPIRQGRSGYYTADHVVRLELVQELQAHGFTLAAIERYLARIPADATPSTIALHRTLLAPWMARAPETMSREELVRRAGRELDDDDLETLETLGVIGRAPDGRFEVEQAYLSVGVGLIEIGFPIEAAQAAREVYADHGRAIAGELDHLFRTLVWPSLKETGADPDRVREVVEKLKPLTISALVAAYENAVDETRRERIARRAR